MATKSFHVLLTYNAHCFVRVKAASEAEAPEKAARWYEGMMWPDDCPKVDGVKVVDEEATLQSCLATKRPKKPKK